MLFDPRIALQGLTITQQLQSGQLYNLSLALERRPVLVALAGDRQRVRALASELIRAQHHSLQFAGGLLPKHDKLPG
jgi:hypothetical protein